MTTLVAQIGIEWVQYMNGQDSDPDKTQRSQMKRRLLMWVLVLWLLITTTLAVLWGYDAITYECNWSFCANPGKSFIWER